MPNRFANRRVLTGAAAIVVLGLVGHAIAAIELTLGGLGALTAAAVAASLASEAHFRWHPRRWVARDGVRAPAGDRPVDPLRWEEGARHAA